MQTVIAKCLDEPVLEFNCDCQQRRTQLPWRFIEAAGRQDLQQAKLIVTSIAQEPDRKHL